MSVYGVLKGTELEPAILGAYNAEKNGAVLYTGMGILAKEQGLNDLSDIFMSIAKEELVHAGMYAELIGKIPENFFKLMPFLQQAEANADKQLGGLADMVEKLGHLDAAAAIRETIPEELRHGAILQKMMEKYQARLESAGNDHEKHTCRICGYEYSDSTAFSDLPADWQCPLCGQAKSVFEKNS